MRTLHTGVGKSEHAGLDLQRLNPQAEAMPNAAQRPASSRPTPEVDMQSACKYPEPMATLQVRNVPEDFHRRLKARAAARGQSLSDYVLDELRVAADRPTMQEWLNAVAALPPQEHTPPPAADVIAAERRR